MHKRPMPRDVNQLAHAIGAIATGDAPPQPEETKDASMSALGKLGASKGGLARAGVLSGRKRAEIARKAAKARWGG